MRFVSFSTGRHTRKCLAALILMALGCLAQTDPGVRGGAAGAGGPLAGLTTGQLNQFNAGKTAFMEIDSVSGTVGGEPGLGLGPSFNLNSCAGCHASPSVGGTSPRTNPQVAIATADGARNTVPSFITSSGPIREARFIRNADGTPDGGVHDLYVITGRVDAGSCTIAQTNFAAQVSAGNVIFRIPTPIFGAGLIEAISNDTILNNKNANAQTKANFGISGHENRSGNDGTITRFGWKAQNPTLAVFSGEAYNVEQGVTNENFAVPRETQPGCGINGHPEDHTNYDTGEASDVVKFALFMQLSAAPTPAPATASTNNGQNLFNQIGCALCHTPTLTTNISVISALNQVPVNLFSDLLVHDMGPGLADQVSQGNAGGDEFRTAPLWGLGQRIFFLHDGRTSNLLTAIQAHGSNANAQFPNSEANAVINNFNSLSASQKQDILNFLRSL
jgi:CxxC motif-containing protein (DUF1111 family)